MQKWRPRDTPRRLCPPRDAPAAVARSTRPGQSRRSPGRQPFIQTRKQGAGARRRGHQSVCVAHLSRSRCPMRQAMGSSCPPPNPRRSGRAGRKDPAAGWCRRPGSTLRGSVATHRRWWLSRPWVAAVAAFKATRRLVDKLVLTPSAIDPDWSNPKSMFSSIITSGTLPRPLAWYVSRQSLPFAIAFR